MLDYDFVEGSFADLTADGMLISTGEAERKGLARGLDASDVLVGTQPRRSRCRASTAPSELGRRRASSHRDTVRRARRSRTPPGSCSSTRADGVSATPTSAPPSTRRSSDYGIGELQDREQFIDGRGDIVDQSLSFIYGLLGLSVIIAVFGIVLTMLLAVYERRRETGLLRAVGMTRSQVRTTVRWESVLTSLYGAVVGVVLGLGARLRRHRRPARPGARPLHRPVDGDRRDRRRRVRRRRARRRDPGAAGDTVRHPPGDRRRRLTDPQDLVRSPTLRGVDARPRTRAHQAVGSSADEQSCPGPRVHPEGSRRSPSPSWSLLRDRRHHHRHPLRRRRSARLRPPRTTFPPMQMLLAPPQAGKGRKKSSRRQPGGGGGGTSVHGALRPRNGRRSGVLVHPARPGRGRPTIRRRNGSCRGRGLRRRRRGRSVPRARHAAGRSPSPARRTRAPRGWRRPRTW